VGRLVFTHKKGHLESARGGNGRLSRWSQPDSDWY